jgi:Tfp pilus assembly protein PilZ
VVPTIEGVTGNISTTGLFISTQNIFDAGTQLRMRLDLYTFRVTFRGQVVWNRGTGTVGRPAGIGVRLVDPPAMYVKFVETLR